MGAAHAHLLLLGAPASTEKFAGPRTLYRRTGRAAGEPHNTPRPWAHHHWTSLPDLGPGRGGGGRDGGGGGLDYLGPLSALGPFMFIIIFFIASLVIFPPSREPPPLCIARDKPSTKP